MKWTQSQGQFFPELRCASYTTRNPVMSSSYFKWCSLKLNSPMKEDLRQLWSQENKASAQASLDDWIRRAHSSKISMLMKFAKTLAVHRTGILSYYDYPISTGPLEGTNNKIKTMKRQAYGFRDIEFFKLKIMAIHQTKYALIG